jgi:hypothetical protein
MTRTFALILMAVLALWGCSKAEHGGGSPSGDVVAQSAVAYGFTYRFALPRAAVDQAQDRHMALCDRLGPARCRMQEMHGSVGEGSTGASTRFAVAAGDARRFGQELLPTIEALGGTLQSRDFEAEDVARQRSDAQAKVAEKGSAANQAALAAVQDRVAISTVWAYYEGKAGFGEQTGAAFAAIGDTLTTSVVMLIYFLSGVLPWALALVVIVSLDRAGLRLVRRGPWRRRTSVLPTDAVA